MSHPSRHLWPALQRRFTDQNKPSTAPDRLLRAFSVVPLEGQEESAAWTLGFKEVDRRAIRFELPEAALAAAAALKDTLDLAEAYVGPEGYGGPWFGITHNDLHGGNIMVDSRSYAWLIDYGEVDDGHVFRDPAKLEACLCYLYTTLPIPPEALLGAPAHEVRCWLSCPMEVAECIVTEAGRRDAVGELAYEGVEDMLRVACAHAGDAGHRIDVDEMMLRFAPIEECDEYLAQACRMVELLAPFRDLAYPLP